MPFNWNNGSNFTAVNFINSALGINTSLDKVILGNNGSTVWEKYVPPTATFEYVGYVQEYTVTKTGTYKLTVYGAEGADAWTHKLYAYGGKGGYATGNVYLTKDQKLYICVGGKPLMNSYREYHHEDNGYPGGYNGGAKGIFTTRDDDEIDGGYGSAGGSGGGGATHIAIGTNRGVLANYANYKSEILIVAGGGGGATCGYNNSAGDDRNGGSGGGATGGYTINNYDGTIYYSNILNEDGEIQYPEPGTQTIGSAQAQQSWAGFGQGGGDYGGTNYGGGGGGWYGGSSQQCHAGAGGSGYIGGVSSGSMQNGIRSGNGYATIEFIG